MNLRKLLYIPTKEQIALLQADVQNILKQCDVIASSEYRDQKEAKESHDGVCPKCRARKEDIVDKIRQVQGKGSVGGSFNLGFGSVSGSMSIDTDEVNHCNKCGNEWKKMKTKYVSASDIVRVTLNYLGDIFDDPDHNKKLKWKLEAIEVFNDCYAESIMVLKSNHSYYMHSNTNNELTYSKLRKYYKSVFDKNKKELQKI